LAERGGRGCAEKTLLAASLVFGGLSFLLPSLVTTYTYVTKWIPEASPEEQKRMKLVLLGSAAAGVLLVCGGVWYLRREGCV
jgi:hypothetical protein